jgi:hypothetical protein
LRNGVVSGFRIIAGLHGRDGGQSDCFETIAFDDIYPDVFPAIGHAFHIPANESLELINTAAGLEIPDTDKAPGFCCGMNQSRIDEKYDGELHNTKEQREKWESDKSELYRSGSVFLFLEASGQTQSGAFSPLHVMI